MSEQAGPFSYLDRHTAKQGANDVRDAAAAEIGGRRQQLWQSLIVEPVTSLSPRWVGEWERFGTALGGGDFTEAAAAFGRLGGLLAELRRLRAEWDTAIEKWFVKEATPWNQQYPDRGPFCHHGPTIEPGWLRTWAFDRPSPAEIPGRLAKRAEDRIPSHRHEYSEYQALIETVFLFDGLGGNANQSDIEARLRRLTHPDQTASVALILAAIVLPDPEILSRFFDSQTGNEKLDVAERVASLSGGVIGEGLRKSFERLRAERYPPSAPPAELPVRGATAHREEESPARPAPQSAGANKREGESPTDPASRSIGMKKAEGGRSAEPFIPLTSWSDILAALNEPHGKAVWKNSEQFRNKVRKLNTEHNGPIKLPAGRGTQPVVDKTALVAWWNGLRDFFDARNEEERAAAESARLTVADSHNYGAAGKVVPDISGSVKRGRAKTDEKGKEGKR